MTVPGGWTNRSDLAAAIRKHGEGFVIAGRDLKKVATGEALRVSVNDHDPALAAAFAELGPTAGLVGPDARAAATHSRTARFAFVAQGPALGAQVLEYSAAVVRAGGCGVLIESSRKVLSPQTWLQLAAEPRAPRSLYIAFVSLAPMPDGSCYYSTGMQALNLPDAAAPPDLSAQAAGEVLGQFLIHCFEHSADLADDRMFRPRNTQHFQMRLRDCEHFPSGHPQHNPHGLWHLR